MNYKKYATKGVGMQIKLIIDGDEQRLVITPERNDEKLLLGMLNEKVASVEVENEWGNTNARVRSVTIHLQSKPLEAEIPVPTVAEYDRGYERGVGMFKSFASIKDPASKSQYELWAKELLEEGALNELKRRNP